jgi:hypothetical protein
MRIDTGKYISFVLDKNPSEEYINNQITPMGGYGLFPETANIF